MLSQPNLTAACIFIAVLSSAAGRSAEARQEFACGSLGSIPALVAESASLRCADGSGNQVDLASNGQKVLCIYATECTPATARVKRKVVEYLKKQKWEQLTDNEIVRAVVELDGSTGVGSLERTAMQVHCVGSRTARGNADCPGVNECANDITSTLVWNVTPMMVNAIPKAGDVKGLRIEKSEMSAPERLEPRLERTTQ